MIIPSIVSMVRSLLRLRPRIARRMLVSSIGYRSVDDGGARRLQARADRSAGAFGLRWVRISPPITYSYRNDWIGSRRAACLAGYQPKKIPTAAATPTDS